MLKKINNICCDYNLYNIEKGIVVAEMFYIKQRKTNAILRKYLAI